METNVLIQMNPDESYLLIEMKIQFQIENNKAEFPQKHLNEKGGS